MRFEKLAFKSGVYAIRNSRNGKIYIGSSINLSNRIKSHTYRMRNGVSKNRYIQADWDLYGPSAFTAHVLVYCLPDHCIGYEQKCFEALEPQYNISPNAGSQLGWRPTKAHTEAHAQRMLALWKDPSFREMVRAKHRPAEVTDDYRSRVSAGLKRHWDLHGEERRALIKSRRKSAIARRLNGSSELSEFRSSLSKSLWADPSYRDKAGSALERMRSDAEVQARRIRTLSSESHKEKMRENSKSLWEDPEYRKKHCKLSDEQVMAIRLSKLSGTRLKELSEQYGISVSQVSAICTGRQYHWVPLPPVT